MPELANTAVSDRVNSRLYDRGYMFSDIRQTFRALDSLARDHRRLNPAMEIVYRELFLKELQEAGMRDEYHPVGSAASHGLMYFLIRALRTFPLTRVMELGAGQSTVLIDRAKHQLSLACEVVTVEHDQHWLSEMQPHVRHAIVHASLQPRTVEGRTISYYAHPEIDAGPPVDLLVVDGPPAYQSTVRFNRLGALDVIEARLAKDFIIVVDDAERPGEALLVDLVRKRLNARGDAHRQSSIAAAKRQTIFAGGAFTKAAFF